MTRKQKKEMASLISQVEPLSLSLMAMAGREASSLPPCSSHFTNHHLPPLTNFSFFLTTNPSPSILPACAKPINSNLQLLAMIMDATLLSLAEPTGFLFLYSILSWLTATSVLLSLSPASFISFFTGGSSRPPTTVARRQPQTEKLIASTTQHETNGLQLGAQDLALVMGAMGFHAGGDEQGKELRPEELNRLFEEKEPSLEEVKEAFRVFDKNGDGFIDAAELQGVLGGLGFLEGLQLEACSRMIKAHDENNDGKIDFAEFVKFMEIAFC